jgi:hypothetical protein
VTHSAEGPAIDSWPRFLAAIRAETERINADPRLALAAASNPLLALEELGYAVAAEAKETIEAQLRFSAQALERRRELAAAIFRTAGREFGLDDPAEIQRVIVELAGARASKVRPRSRGSRAETQADRGVEHVAAQADSLEAMREAHPVVPLLIEYRSVEQRGRRLAPRELYDRIRRGDLRTGVTAVRLKQRTR